ncbi:hypothetical protein BGZ54_005232 [Gamsiella multidivaricata]|nr:hypothetical protein BGZ54_005232 [Gamsiella multidivaricata]
MPDLLFFCLSDGEPMSNAFPVSIPSTNAIGNLKELIKAKKTPKFDDLAADELTLWRVSVRITDDDELPIVLSTLKENEKKKLCPTTRLPKVFTEEPPEEAIHIIAQRPSPVQYTDLISEYQFVQRAFEPVTDIHQRVHGMMTDTTRTYSLTPTLVAVWDGFLTLVCQMQLKTEPIHPRPSFLPVRTFVTEPNLHAAFQCDVGSVQSLPPFANTLSSTGLRYSVPDLVCSRQNDPASILFLIEMKMPSYLYLDDGTGYSTAYKAQESRTQGPAGALRQIFGYMRFNGFHYGVLSTYIQTWFIKRVKERENHILVSPTIQYDSTEPTLLQCYLWLIRMADKEVKWQPVIPDSPTVDNMLANERLEDEIEERDPDWRQSPGVSVEPGTKRPRTRSIANEQAGVTERELTNTPAFENMELIAQGEGARTFRASWPNGDVVFKKADRWNQQEVVRELEHEARVYQVLQKLQGQWIPKLKIAGIADELEMILVTEFIGPDLCEGRLDLSDRKKIRAALSAIHRLGILHGDIRPHNIVARRDGGNSQFFFIDFGRSVFTREKKFLKHEAKELESLLGTMPWPEGETPPL